MNLLGNIMPSPWIIPIRTKEVTKTTLDDIVALLSIVPYNPGVLYHSPVGWVSYCRSLGLLNELEWSEMIKIVKLYNFVELLEN
jgi:diadenosine tetraphosphate (Ap4A) HIT family hydrolase